MTQAPQYPESYESAVVLIIFYSIKYLPACFSSLSFYFNKFRLHLKYIILTFPELFYNTIFLFGFSVINVSIKSYKYKYINLIVKLESFTYLN